MGPSSQEQVCIQWEDSEPGAQTECPDAVSPVRGLLGGTTSPALSSNATAIGKLPKAKFNAAAALASTTA
jgi:hypothetical protein